MAAEPEMLEAALNAAVGNDPALFAELRQAFLAGARAHVAAMARAPSESLRATAAWRLHGLAASFGALTLMAAAAKLATARGADPVLLRRVHAAIDALEG